MRKLFIIIGFITAILSVVLAVTPLSKISIVPTIIAFVFGLIVLYLSKKQNKSKKVVQYIFLLAIISLSLTIYKAIFSTTEVSNVEEIQKKADESVEDSKNILEDLNFED
jgi:D-alanyl-lipoteichoic acid acyltransferase DltB (MBOAT superfamily)